MNVLSLFDGMSCCRIALEQLGIKLNNYYAAEIDKFAIKMASHLYPGTKHLGDVTKWQEWNIDYSKIDLVTGGFLCQVWSTAGKQLGDKDDRGKLFWVMLDIMQAVIKANPRVKFLIENVKMKKEFEEYITHHTTAALGQAHKILINSALVSAQNRNRCYWCNWHSEQPEDKGILLKDILETPGNGVIKHHGEYKDKLAKSQCLDANYHKGPDNHGQRTLVRHYEPNVFIQQKPRGKNKVGIKAENGKAPTLNANSWQDNNHLVTVFAAVSYNRKDKGGKELSKSYTLNASDYRGLNRNQNQTAVTDGFHYRKLTPRECARLQTIPEPIIDKMLNAGISNTQLYKMAGNGWTIDVIAHLFSSMELPVQIIARQLSLFEDAA